MKRKYIIQIIGFSLAAIFNAFALGLSIWELHNTSSAICFGVATVSFTAGVIISCYQLYTFKS